MTRDEEGHREYHPVLLVGCDPTDGPANVLAFIDNQYPPGTYWNIANDTDQWAWRHTPTTLTPTEKTGPVQQFECQLVFTTRPPKRCMDLEITDPLLEPPKLSGSFVKAKLEASEDRYGVYTTTSSFEQLRGPQVEFDHNTMTVKIEQNIADLQLPFLSEMRDGVNDQPLWGVDARCVKLSNVTWERLFYGFCSIYYKRTLEFEIDENTFDRHILDESTKVLSGRWGNTSNIGDGTNYWIDVKFANDGTSPDPNPDNPAHFIVYRDPSGQPSRVILDGAGRPYIPTPVGSVYVPEDYCFFGTQSQAQSQLNIDLAAFGGTSGTLLGPCNSEQTCRASFPIPSPSPLDLTYPRWWRLQFSLSDDEGPGYITVEKYPSVNLLLLGIPSTLV